MTQLIARLVLAMLVLPLAGAVFVLLAVALVSNGPPEVEAIASLWLVVYAFIAFYWVMVWRDAVRWTPYRRRMTLAWGAASLVASILMSLLLWSSFVRVPAASMMVGGGVAPIVWVLATVFVWRETPQERIDRVSRIGKETVLCPICGYNMTGLTQIRCPECGAQFTIDKLLAGQPERDTTELTDT